MKILTYIITLLFFINLYSDEVNEEQIKVAYTYNFMKNITWQNEAKLDKYRLLIISKNDTLKNMFSMLASRKQLKDKNLEILIYDEKKNYKNIQAIYIDENFSEVYEKLFFEYEKENTLFISDDYRDKKQVMINLIKNETKLSFEINKANILNRALEISPNLILLGGTEIDVAKLYKSSQDALKEQKETINSLNQKIEAKNLELNFKINSIEEQKVVINNQTKNIKSYEEKLNNQAKLLEEQKKQLNEIQTNIESEKNKLSNAIINVKDKEGIVETLINLQKDKQLEFEKTKKDLEFLNSQIEEQKNNLLVKENIISDQKNIIFALIILSVIIIVLGLNGLRLNRLLKDLSQTDALSGLYNRRYMNKKLEEEIMKYKRYKIPFSVLLLDIDYFKKINDTYGHDKGDLVIKTISSLMQKHIRNTDICARWGGEEFLILASNSDLEGATKLANNLKKLVESSEFEINHNITVSIGVSSMNTHLEQETLLKLVDNALYKAKEKGRNRVEIA